MPPDHDAVEGDGPHAHLIQCRLPLALYEWLRLKAFQTRRSMNSITVEAVRVSRVEMEASHTALPGRLSSVGGGEAKVYSIRLDDDLYEELRTAVFYAHSSFNALVVAALTRAQDAQAEGTTALDAD